MAEQIISPGVFTRENDLSFLPQGIGAIGAAIVGPTTKGPAFVPTVVRSFAEFERRFGGLDSKTYVPQTVFEYLKNAGSVTVCRVLGGSSYSYTNTNSTIAIIASSSQGGANNVLLGAIFPSKNSATPDLGLSTLSTTGDLGDNFSLVLSGSQGGSTITAGTTQFSASVNPANSNYIFKQIGDNNDNSKDGANSYTGTPGYTYLNFKQFQTDIFSTLAETTSITIGSAADTLFLSSSLQDTALGASGSFYLQDGDGTFHTFTFNTPEQAAPATDVSGSNTEVALTSIAATDGNISASDLAGALQTSINSNANFTATVLSKEALNEPDHKLELACPE